MKRTIMSTMCIAVAFVFTASCNRMEDNPVTSVGNGRTVITAVAEAVGKVNSKAHNQYSYEVLWDEGDKIYVTGGGKSNTFTVSDESAGTSKGKFTEDTPSYGIKGDIEAFYPASLHTEGGDYVWPAVQTNNQAPPMYVHQTISGTSDETVNFSSLGAMLQIVFNSTTPDIAVTSVTIRDAAKPLSGKFTVDNGQAIIDDGSENVGITLDLGTGVVMGKSAKYFYIAIPAGKYNGDEITLTFTDINSGAECVMKSNTFPNVARNTVGRVTLSGSFKDKVPAGALPGKFTVDMEGKQVFFSRGNLHATWHSSTGSYSWDFADNQYDIVSDAPGNTTIGEGQADGAAVSLFGWSTPATYYGIDTSLNRDEYPGDFIDWGTAYCNSADIAPGDSWRTLSKNEWDYLLRHNKHGWATVNGIDGLVIAPDGFEGSLSTIYEPYHLSTYNLVFLPAESSRSGIEVNLGVGQFGHYYSETRVTGYSAFSLYFYNGYTGCNNFENRHIGCSVRLVTDVNYIPAAQRSYTVSFYSSMDIKLDPFMADAGATIARPDDPTAPGFEFKGWYKDYNCEYAWDFDNDRVTRDIVLFPKWERIPN